MATQLVDNYVPASAKALIPAIRGLAATASVEMLAREIRGLAQAGPLLAPGSTVSIGWLPADGDDDRVAAAVAIRDAGMVPLVHLAARRIASEGAIDGLLTRLQDEAGVTDLFVIGGDIRNPVGPYASALELLSRTLRGRPGIRRIGFGAYPEPHPVIPRELLDSQLDTKIAVAIDAGLAPFVTTQFCFSADPILGWLEAFRQRWPDIPVRIGLTGPAGVRTLLRYARLCGVGASSRALIGNGASIARLLTEAGSDPIIRAIAEQGAIDRFGPIDLHLFSFGGLDRTARWLSAVARGSFKLRPSEAGFQLLPHSA